VPRRDLIVFGLKRSVAQAPGGGAGAGQGRDDGETPTRMVLLCVTAAMRVRRTLRGLGTWAAGRSISPNSLSGISLLLALCAAAWFSGGPGQDSARGALAMIGWLAGLPAARCLAVAVGEDAALRFAWLWRVCAAAGECAIYGGMAAGNEAAGLVGIWPLAVGTVIAVATTELLGACMAVALAAGPVERSGRAEAILRWIGRFLRLPAGVRGSMALLAFAVAGADGAFFAVLAVAVLSIAVTVTMLGKIAPAERRPAPRSGSATPSPGPARRRAIGARSAKTARVPLRAVSRRTPWPAPMSGITIIGGLRSQGGTDAVQVTTPASGADQVSETAGARGAARPAGAGSSAGLNATPRARGTAGSSRVGRTSGTAASSPMRYATGATDVGGTTGQTGVRNPADVAGTGGTVGPRGAGYAADAGTGRIGDLATTMVAGEAAEASDARADGARAEPACDDPVTRSDASRTETTAGGALAGQANTQATAREVLLALRDDGAAARWAGRLVQGALIPLPPALAGLVATSLLAILGVRNLAGFIVLTPPVVMMLAAPGSSHRHDRRFDWLVPVLLALAQYVYLAPLGFALALPGPVIFAACALIFIWYTGVIAAAVGSGGGTSVGWETRMFTIGLATTFGLAAFGYVGLAAYLGVLICRKVMTGYLVPREEDWQ
jgi:hypothetical protein